MNSLLKIVVFVPETHADQVRQAIGDTGAGQIGDYSHCSFSSKGVGRFKPLEGANSSIGEVGKLEAVKEEKVEFICSKDKAKEVISAIKQIHPYEEVALDVYPLLCEKEL